MRLLVDTSVLIDQLRGDDRAVRLLRSAVTGGDELWSVAVVRTEVLVGVRGGEEAATHRLLDALRWLDVTVELADQAGELGRRYLPAFPGIDVADLLVAAATQTLGARLLTQNVHHFPMVAGLTAAYP